MEIEFEPATQQQTNDSLLMQLHYGIEFQIAFIGSLMQLQIDFPEAYEWKRKLKQAVDKSFDSIDHLQNVIKHITTDAEEDTE